jgi:hypothetical protein
LARWLACSFSAPRRRPQNQLLRINTERAEGELSYAQAMRLRDADLRIINEDRRDAYWNGGYITPAQQFALNNQENAVSALIGW